MKIEIPADATDYVRNVFATCNRRTAQRLMEMPTTHEESLDLTFIEQLTHFAAPVQVPSSWVVRIDTHFLGGRRHFGSWEIADIGIIVIFRQAGKVVRSKVALLQSKRLYPNEQKEAEAEREDYEIGFARLYKGTATLEAITQPKLFTFSDVSCYEMLKPGSAQYKAITDYERKFKIPVYYLLYHPWQIPYNRAIPVTVQSQFEGEVRVGCRVLPSIDIRRTARRLKTQQFKYGDLKHIVPKPATLTREGPGWLLEEFVELLLQCRVGYIAEKERDIGLERVFSRRTGPIAAAIAITLDAPGDIAQQ